MDKVKISTLNKDDIVSVEGEFLISTVEDILNDLDHYKNRVIYTTIPHYAYFNSKSIIESAIEDEYNDGMYEDWCERIREDITEEDIKDLQKIFDRILSRSPNQNVAYEADKLIEIDI